MSNEAPMVSSDDSRPQAHRSLAELEAAKRELEQRHEALRRSEQRYRVLVEHSPEAIAVHRAGVLVYVNRAAIDLFGARTEADLVGRSILDLIHADSHGFVLTRVHSAVEDGVDSVPADVALLKLDGSRIEAEIQGLPILFEGQACLLASMRDITKRKQTEEALRRSRARLRGIFESATDAIISADESQVIVSANPAAARMFRCALGEMVGSPLERFIPARHRAAHRGDVQAFGATAYAGRRMGLARDVTALRGDGDEFRIEAGISHVEIHGKPLYTAILRDITQRLHAEEELLASKATMEAALSSMSDAVLLTDAQGRFVNFNEAFATFHRFESKPACPKTLAEYPAILDVSRPGGELLPLEEWAVPSALRGETGTGVEYKLRRKDTGQSWIGSHSYAPIRSAAGAVIGAVVTCRDVTAQKTALADLEASHATLRRLIAVQDSVQEEERKRIARDLHDDLQQTLAGIRIELGALAERLAADPTHALPLVSEVDRLALAAVTSTRRIVNDLRPQLLDELGLVPALEVLSAQFARRKRIACSLDARADLGAALMATPAVAGGLFRVTQEALNNIAKHAKASAVEIRLGPTGDGLALLRIHDNGTGIRKRDRSKPEAFGLLGMAERVRALGGQLRIDSNTGGTTIEVLVPLPHATSRPAMQADFPPTATSSAPGEFNERHGDRHVAGLELGNPLQAVVDAIGGHVAVLDRQGTIQLVNRSWREFAERNGDPGMRRTGPGINYLEVCRRSAADDPSALPVLCGMSEVLDGTREAYIVEYACDGPGEPRWFRMHLARITGDGAIVTHTHLGSRVPAAPPVDGPRPPS